MTLTHKIFPRRPLDGALAATLWFEPNLRELEALKSLLDSSAAPPLPRQGAGRPGPASILLRRTLFLTPPTVRPYFAVCALEAWRRVSVRHLAGWSGIPLTLLKRRLAATGFTPAGVAAWNLALHAAWLLDVAELPASTVVGCMRLGRPAALAAVLGARAVRFYAGKVEPGAFTITLDRYLAVLRAAFRV
ncbi:MAG TPA: hypothetical protein VFY42_03960 [Gemmatimonadales bacterium]|nr:hypothetical protein [Gemmatimonadales bacterium]